MAFVRSSWPVAFEFACQSKACAPPPVGTGGSKPGGNRYEALFSGFSHNGVTVEVSSDERREHTAVKVKFKRDGKVVGYADREIFHDGSEAYHASFYLHEDAQGQGVGSAFVQHSLEQYRRLGVKRVTIDATSFDSLGWNGAEVWRKVGFDFNGQAQPTLVKKMDMYSDLTRHKWPKGLRDRVESGEASIHEVAESAPEFLLGRPPEMGQINWRGSILLDQMALVASAKVRVSLKRWGEAEESGYGRARRSTTAG